MLAVLFTLTYMLFAPYFLSLLTDNNGVITTASRFRWWIVAVPLAGFAAFLWDGVFMGLTTTRRMLFSMATATAIFFLIFFVTGPRLGNDGLWLAFVSYLFVRGMVQTLYCPLILKEERMREAQRATLVP
jgi:MATE family multidrug resistance protein